MTQAAETAPTTSDQIVNRLLRQIEAAWVTGEFDAIIEANWPAEPPEPPPAAGPAHPEPPRQDSPTPVPAAGGTASNTRPSESVGPSTCATPAGVSARFVSLWWAPCPPHRRLFSNIHDQHALDD